MTEQQIQAAILATLGARPDVRLWRQNAGMAVPLEELKRAQRNGRKPVPVRYGVNGCGDLSGVLMVSGLGIRLEVEVKAANGRQSDDQKRFQAMIERFGGIYILARSVEEALEQLTRARRRIRREIGFFDEEVQGE